MNEGAPVRIRRRAGRLCSNCEHAYLGPTGVWCRLHGEDIGTEETEAIDCPDFRRN